jgi:hypothetical protein
VSCEARRASQHERASADNGVGVVSHVRVHAESMAARLSDVEGLGAVVALRAEDWSLSQLQRQSLAVMLVDSSSVRAEALANTLGLSASLTLASLTLRMVVYGLAQGDDETVLDFATVRAKGFVYSEATSAELSDTVIRVLVGTDSMSAEGCRGLIESLYVVGPRASTVRCSQRPHTAPERGSHPSARR